MTVRAVPLGEVADIERSSIKPEDIQGGETYVGLENISNGGEFVDVGTVSAGELKSNKFRFDADHVLYGKLRPYLAKIAAPEFGGICSTDILPIRPGNDLDRRYLLQYLRLPTMVAHISKLAVGANLPRISPKSLAGSQSHSPRSRSSGGLRRCWMRPMSSAPTPPSPRQARHPHPSHLHRHVRRPCRESLGLARRSCPR